MRDSLDKSFNCSPALTGPAAVYSHFHRLLHTLPTVPSVTRHHSFDLTWVPGPRDLDAGVIL
jgi:hypothetical protein